MELTSRGLNDALSHLSYINDGIVSEKPMRKAVLILTHDARANAPAFMGELRASIMPQVVTRGKTVTGIVGSKLIYARIMEKGHKPFWPKKGALEVWAERHGTTEFLVARAISKKGIAPRNYLQNALDDNERNIIREFQDYYNRLAK